MHAVKTNLFNQISPVIENQLHIFSRQRNAQDGGVRQQFGINAGLVAVLQQSHASISQCPA